MKNSEIAWCDNTFNPWEGCTMVSPGCNNCYALARDERFSGGIHWGKGAPRRRTSAVNWRQPIKWNKSAICSCGSAELIGSDDCRKCGKPFAFRSGRRNQRVFCASLADWLDDEVPIEWLTDLLKLIQDTPNLDWLLLTKRPQNFAHRIQMVHAVTNDRELADWMELHLDGSSKGAPNIWMGTTVENQAMADLRIPQLLSIPARIRFLSLEPMLERMNLQAACFNGADSFGIMPGVHWVICGGESGPKARPFNADWARDISSQCQIARVPFFMKQLGQREFPKTFRDFNTFNAHLQTREFPV